MAQGGSARTLDVTSGVIWRQLLALCVPIFLSSFFQQAYNLANTFVVGQFGGKLALGGIQSCMVLGDLCIGFSLGVGSGCAVVAGQYFGAGDEGRLRLSVHTAVTISLVIGAAFSATGVLLLEPILALMGTPAELMGEALAFGRLYFGAMLFTLVYNMGAALMRSVGDAKTPSRIVICTCLVNIALDLVLVAWLRLDALGCGIATAISMALSAVLMCARLMTVDANWRLRPSELRLTPSIARAMVRVGLPLGLQSSAYTVSNLIVQASVNSFGTDAVAAWGLQRRLDSIVWLASDALGVAVTTFAAQNFGARNYRRMRQSLHTSLVLTACIIGSLSAVLVIFVPQLTRLFIADAGVIADTTLIMRFIAPFYVCYSLMDNVAGIIRGAGESLRPMLLTIFGTCVFRVVWLLAVVPVHHSIEMVLVSYPVTWLLTGLLFVIYYRCGHWLQHAQDRERATQRA